MNRSVPFYDRASEALPSSVANDLLSCWCENPRRWRTQRNGLQSYGYNHVLKGSRFLPAIRHNCCAWLDPFFYEVKQNLFRSVFYCRDKAFAESSMLPKTHWPSTTWPQWYFLFPILLSSIWTNFPAQPIFFLPSNAISHTSRQNISQSTAVCEPSPSCCFICHCLRSWHHQYVNFNTSSIVKSAFSNQLPSLMLLSRLCRLPLICFLHSQT